MQTLRIRTMWVGVIVLLAAVCLTAPAWAATNYTQDANIVSWWSLDESSTGVSTVTRYDGSSNNNDLTDTNTTASSVTKKEGSASADLELTNDESLVITDGSQAGLEITGDLTIVAWIRLETAGSATTFVSKDDNAASNSVYALVMPADQLRLRLSDGSTIQNFTGSAGALTSTGVWYHVAATVSGASVKLYINGAQTGTTGTFTGSRNGTSTCDFRVGERGDGGQNLDGMIDEVVVFNRALSDAEILEVYNNGLTGNTRISAVPVNVRSIGINNGTIYSTGTVTLLQGSRTATFGGGASLPSSIGEGDALLIGGSTTYYILSRDSSTQVTVSAANVSGGDHSGATYTISRVYGGSASSAETELQAWETARQGNLVTSDVIEKGVCYNDGTFTAGLTIDGSTTDATRYLWLTTASGHRHTGTAGTGVRAYTTTFGVPTIDVSDSYVTVDGLEISDTGDYYAVACYTDNVTIRNMLIYNLPNARGGGGVGIYFDDTSSTGMLAYNNIIYNSSSGIIDIGIRAYWQSTGPDKVYNNTMYNMMAYGIYADNSASSSKRQVEIRNNLIVDSGTADYAEQSAGGFVNELNNLSSDGTADDFGGTGHLVSKTAVNQFVSITSGSENLHLTAVADAKNAGTDLSGTFTTDIDGSTRSGTWDIGADEYVAVNSPLTIQGSSLQWEGTGFQIEGGT